MDSVQRHSDGLGQDGRITVVGDRRSFLSGIATKLEGKTSTVDSVKRKRLSFVKVVQYQVQVEYPVKFLVEVDFKTVDVLQVLLNYLNPIDNRLHNIDRAVANTYAGLSETDVFEKLINVFDEEGYTLDTGENIEDTNYLQLVDKVPGLREELAQISGTSEIACVISALEFVLEGLHLTKRLNKIQKDGQNSYSHL